MLYLFVEAMLAAGATLLGLVWVIRLESPRCWKLLFDAGVVTLAPAQNDHPLVF